MLSIRGFINFKTQDSSIFYNNMNEKVMDHLQSTVTKTILSKPIFAGTIPELYPQWTPISHSSKFSLYPEKKAQFNLQESGS